MGDYRYLYNYFIVYFFNSFLKLKVDGLVEWFILVGLGSLLSLFFSFQLNNKLDDSFHLSPSTPLYSSISPSNQTYL